MSAPIPIAFAAFSGEARAAKQDRGHCAAAHDAYRKLLALSKPSGSGAPQNWPRPLLSNELKTPCGRKTWIELLF